MDYQLDEFTNKFDIDFKCAIVELKGLKLWVQKEKAFTIKELNTLQQQFELQEIHSSLGDFNWNWLHVYNELLEDHTLFKFQPVLIKNNGKNKQS